MSTTALGPVQAIELTDLPQLLVERPGDYAAFAAAAPERDWWDWYTAYVDAREHGCSVYDAEAAADLMAERRDAAANAHLDRACLPSHGAYWRRHQSSEPKGRKQMTTSTPINSAESTTKKIHVFLTRGGIAIAWAAVFAAAANGLTTDVTFGAAILLVLYPLIDSVASAIDARSQHGSARRLLVINAATSAAAAVALGIAATGTVADVFAVFGVWAIVSGASQLATAIHRRSQLGKQWPMRLAGGVSVFLGVLFIVASAGTNPMLRMLAVYAASGGADFVIEAWLLARRRRHTVTHPVAA